MLLWVAHAIPSASFHCLLHPDVSLVSGVELDATSSKNSFPVTQTRFFFNIQQFCSTLTLLGIHLIRFSIWSNIFIGERA